jgi:hypothetical protein
VFHSVFHAVLAILWGEWAERGIGRFSVIFYFSLVRREKERGFLLFIIKEK